MGIIRRLTTCLLLGLAGSVHVRADFGDILFELDGPGLGAGTSVAINSDYVIVGSPERGRVISYDLRTGERLVDIRPDEPIPGFGGEVKVDGSFALVGGRGTEAVYVYDVTTGGLLQTLMPEDPRPNQNFGSSIAIDDGVVLVGAPGDDEQQDRGGAAYVFDFESGAQLRKLSPDVEFPRRGLIPFFGGALALENGLAVIGESNSEVVEGRYAIGGAYVFDVATGQPLRKLKNPTPINTHDLFSSSIDVESGRAIIGASGLDDACPGLGQSCWSGAAFVFDLATGESTTKLTIDDGRPKDHFGAAAVLDGDVAIVGGMNEAANGYFFDVTSGRELLRIPGGDIFAAADGKAVVVAGNRTYVIDIAEIPEPSSLSLFAIAGVAIVRWTRRRTDRDARCLPH